MKIGFVDITGVTRKRPIGWDIIAWFTSSPIVHAFVIFDDTVYQTSEVFFEKIPLANRLSGTPCHIFNCIGIDDKAALAYAETFKGKVYDYPGVVYLGLLGLFEKVVNWVAWPVRYLISKQTNRPIDFIRLKLIGNPYQAKEFLFCTEAAFEIASKGFDAAKIKAFPDWWTGSNIYPHQFMQYCQEQPSMFNYEGKIQQ